MSHRRLYPIVPTLRYSSGLTFAEVRRLWPCTEAFYGRAQFYIATGHEKEFRKMLALVPARAELVTALELGQP